MSEASPGLTAGRGLKHHRRRPFPVPADRASPGLTAGRGLKHPVADKQRNRLFGIARPHGRARIETSHRRNCVPAARSIARPHGRARIETGNAVSHPAGGHASPGLTAGRGLKRAVCACAVANQQASPGLTAGRGLKRAIHRSRAAPSPASPGLTAGRGLKRHHCHHLAAGFLHRPASRPGAD